MKDHKDGNQDHSADVDARRDEALRRALTTPPTPHKKPLTPKQVKNGKSPVTQRANPATKSGD